MESTSFKVGNGSHEVYINEPSCSQLSQNKIPDLEKEIDELEEEIPEFEEEIPDWEEDITDFEEEIPFMDEEICIVDVHEGNSMEFESNSHDPNSTDHTYSKPEELMATEVNEGRNIIDDQQVTNLKETDSRTVGNCVAPVQIKTNATETGFKAKFIPLFIVHVPKATAKKNPTDSTETCCRTTENIVSPGLVKTNNILGAKETGFGKTDSVVPFVTINRNVTNLKETDSRTAGNCVAPVKRKSNMEMSVAKCEFCSKEFSTAEYCNRHVKRVHMKNTNDKPEVDYTCVLCDKQFNQKCSLQRHISTVHIPEDKKYFYCDQCTYKTISNCNLKRHSLKVHEKGKDEVIDFIRPHKCTLCNAQYKHLHRLRYHERQTHKIGVPPMIIIERKCPVCNDITTGPNAEQDMHKHFERVHNIDIQIEKLHFDSIDSFFAWKKETEKKTVSVFIKKFSSSKAMTYRCHRCGVYKNRGSNKRHLKMKGSCKIGAFCPAMIKVKTMTDQSVTVDYISKHIGHEMELEHIQLTKEEREQIATQIASKIPRNDILKAVRGTISNNGLERIHLINRKDIINIEKSLNLNSESINHSFEPVSVEDEQKKDLIEEFKAMVESSIETEEEVELVKNHLKQLIPTLAEIKLASGRPLLQIKCGKPDFPVNSKIENNGNF